MSCKYEAALPAAADISKLKSLSTGWNVKQRICKNIKPVKSRQLCQHCVLIIFSALLLDLAFPRNHLSDDVACLFAADLEDIHEVIENLSNLAIDYSILGDLMRPNPNICNLPQGLEV